MGDEEEKTGYDPEYVLKEGVLEKVTAAPPTGLFTKTIKYKWEKRYVAMTPTNLLYFKNGQQPAKGTEPKMDLYLGEKTRVEEVRPDELPVSAFHQRQASLRFLLFRPRACLLIPLSFPRCPSSFTADRGA